VGLRHLRGVPIESTRTTECERQKAVLKQLMHAQCEHVQSIAAVLLTQITFFQPLNPLTTVDMAQLFPADTIAFLGSDDADTRETLFKGNPEVSAWCVVANALFPAS